jgi:hypothetical protein
MDNKLYAAYKKKKIIDKSVIISETNDRYGSVCKLAMCLGWAIGQDDVSTFKTFDLHDIEMIKNLENLGNLFGLFLKLHDDFKNVNRDIIEGNITRNFIVNYGIKYAYSELVEVKAELIEKCMLLGIETKTSKEIIDTIVKNVDHIVKNVSVDIDTEYDDVSTIATVTTVTTVTTVNDI